MIYLQVPLLSALPGAINGGIGYYMINKGKTLQSITLEADGKHLLTDMVTSGWIWLWD